MGGFGRHEFGANRHVSGIGADSFIGRGFKISFESPKNEKLALFEHGERAYDHLILLPPKSKG